MKRTTLDLWVGFFVAIGLAALMFLAFKVGNLNLSDNKKTYVLQAQFGNIGGLKVRAPVRSAGVTVGRISDIHLDPETYMAAVTMNVDSRYQFPRDTFATINTAGLIGEQYIGLEVGGAVDMYRPGESIKKTQDAVVLEKLISQFMFNKAADNSSDPK